MLVEFSVIPLHGEGGLSDEMAEVLNIVDLSGLPYQFTPSGTILEGEWAEVMRIVKLCHDRMRERSPQVVTMIKIEDEEGAQNKLRSNITAVEQKLGRSLQTTAGGEGTRN